jgi:hypothetical protein
VKAVVVVTFFTILSSIVGLVGNSTSLLSDVVYFLNGTVDMMTINRIVSMSRTIISFVQVLFILALGFKALSGGDVSLGPVDNVINKNI